MDSVSMETNLYMFAIDNVDRHMAPLRLIDFIYVYMHIGVHVFAVIWNWN